MTRLHTCNSNYQFNPPQDINPLLLQLYEKQKILVLAARDAQQKRIKKTVLSWGPKDTVPKKLDVIGWWELGQEDFLDDFGAFKYNKFLEYDAVVVLSPDRVHNIFQKAMTDIMNFIKQKSA